MTQATILYAEDDETLAFLTRDSLEQHGYTVVHCNNGHMCLEQFRKKHFDLCILDILLPGMDGFELIEAMRRNNPDIPVLFLSAKSLKEERIKGLRLGADDYLVKPFSMEELLLKIAVFLKRPVRRKEPESGTYTFGNTVFNASEHKLHLPGQTIALTQRESQLLQYFLDNRNQVLKREQILKALWGTDDYFMGRSLDVFI